VRIIGGQWGSRLVRFPEAQSLRPTPDRLRETLFNWLGQDLTGKNCLDLFAGSGVLGFEAASRGARQVVLVEHNTSVYHALCKTQALLAAEQVEVHRADAFSFLKTDLRQFDVVFLDPPFESGLLEPALAALPPHLAPGALVYVEWLRKTPLTLPPGYTLSREKQAGQVSYGLATFQGPA